MENKKIRLFVAVNIPDELKELIGKKFLGKIPKEQWEIL